MPDDEPCLMTNRAAPASSCKSGCGRSSTSATTPNTSDQDTDGDEIAELVITFEPDRETVSVCVETWGLPSLNTVAVVELGSRQTRAEILLLCRALGAWAIKYPAGVV